MLAQVIGDGGHCIGEGLGLFGSQRVEDQLLDVLNVERCHAFEPFSTGSGEGGVLGSAVIGVLAYVNLASLDKNAEPVGEPTLRHVCRVRQLAEAQGLIWSVRQHSENMVVNDQ